MSGGGERSGAGRGVVEAGRVGGEEWSGGRKRSGVEGRGAEVGIIFRASRSPRWMSVLFLTFIISLY